MAKPTADDIEKTICGTKPTLVVSSVMTIKRMKIKRSGRDGGRYLRDQKIRTTPAIERQAV
jgi:hypothetical protein